MLHETALALLRQELAGNLVLSHLLQVVGACRHVLLFPGQPQLWC